MESKRIPNLPDPSNGLWDLDAPIPEGIYPVIDTDLARDNLENDIPRADLEDLHGMR